MGKPSFSAQRIDRGPKEIRTTHTAATDPKDMTALKGAISAGNSAKKFLEDSVKTMGKIRTELTSQMNLYFQKTEPLQHSDLKDKLETGDDLYNAFLDVEKKLDLIMGRGSSLGMLQGYLEEELDSLNSIQKKGSHKADAPPAVPPADANLVLNQIISKGDPGFTYEMEFYLRKPKDTGSVLERMKKAVPPEVASIKMEGTNLPLILVTLKKNVQWNKIHHWFDQFINVKKVSKGTY